MSSTISDIALQINNRGSKNLDTGASVSTQPLDISQITRFTEGTGIGEANDLSTLQFIVQGPTNEIQSLQIIADAGTYTLDFDSGGPTAAIAFGADAATVQTALETLTTIGGGDVLVSGGPGDATGSAPYVIEFTGALAAAGQNPLVADDALLLVDGLPGTANVTTTRQGGANTPQLIDLTDVDDNFGDPSDYARLNTIIAVSQAIDEDEVLTIGDITATQAWTGWGGERILYPGADVNNLSFIEWINPSDNAGAAVLSGSEDMIQLESAKNRITVDIYLIGVLV